MKVEFCKSIDVESEVNITVEDITDALRESLDDASNDGTRHSVARFINDLAQCLRAVTPEMIELLQEQPRRLVGAVLREQANRFWPETNS